MIDWVGRGPFSAEGGVLIPLLEVGVHNNLFVCSLVCKQRRSGGAWATVLKPPHVCARAMCMTACSMQSTLA